MSKNKCNCTWPLVSKCKTYCAECEGSLTPAQVLRVTGQTLNIPDYDKANKKEAVPKRNVQAVNR